MSTNKPSLEDSVRLAIEAAGAANAVAADISQMKAEYEAAAGRLDTTRKHITTIAVAGIGAVALTVGFGALVYFRTLGELERANATQMEALTVFAETVGQLTASLEGVQEITAAYEKMAETEGTTQSEIVARLDAMQTVMVSEMAALSATEPPADPMAPQIARSIEEHVDEASQSVKDEVRLAVSDLQVALAKMIATEFETMSLKQAAQMAAMPKPVVPAPTTRKTTTSKPKTRPAPNPFSYP